MKIHRAIILVTLLALTKTAVSQLQSIEQCREVFDSFMPCMGFVEGIFQQPSPQCCRGVSHLNNVVKFKTPGSRKNEQGTEELERVCECIEIMGKADHLPFLTSAINNLPPLCSLSLSFPISVGMDCSQFRNMKELDAEKNPFVPMGIFASIVPVVTLGSISKGWLVPGWRIGWMAMNDPSNVFKTTGVVESIKHLLNISPDPSTILQFALPNILEKTKKDYFEKKNLTLSQNVDMMFDALKEIPCLVCPKKPESCTSLVTKLDLSLLEDITDDVDFCMKLAREENLVLLPGEVFGKNNWVRISIGVERSMLQDAFVRLKDFFTRHIKSQTT
ncbi:hypothetical protein F2Q68_00037521 [Brassica cretica]|uniref:Aminotransferase class I/classII domain-containing protein n=2 Tax=Brassica cretica TaxID=69181 RepID=A0A8S9H0S7_BRACR|nr:hypothetical protein F2Q68_00037521 [Brassica cretica]